MITFSLIKRRYSLLTFACSLLLTACQPAASTEEILEIPFSKADSIHIDGDLSDWDKVSSTFSVSQFVSPWSDPNFGETSFQAFHDKEWFYFSFAIADSTIVEAPFDAEEAVAAGDRAEIFLSGDPKLSTYYCFELAPSGHVLDYEAKFYRQFDYPWDLKELQIAKHKDAQGYRIEGKMPMTFLKSMRPAKTEKPNELILYLGLYRGEYKTLNPKEEDINWITWIDPKVEKPDFHIPTSFRAVKFKLD